MRILTRRITDLREEKRGPVDRAFLEEDADDECSCQCVPKHLFPTSAFEGLFETLVAAHELSGSYLLHVAQPLSKMYETCFATSLRFSN